MQQRKTWVFTDMAIDSRETWLHARRRSDFKYLDLRGKSRETWHLCRVHVSYRAQQPYISSHSFSCPLARSLRLKICIYTFIHIIYICIYAPPLSLPPSPSLPLSLSLLQNTPLMTLLFPDNTVLLWRHLKLISQVLRLQYTPMTILSLTLLLFPLSLTLGHTLLSLSLSLSMHLITNAGAWDATKNSST